ncbi:MAG TPA: FAD-linked oxidase C-terminal domain-containing protein [Candidatus Gastranaerophilaceae bacterium]|nr:FAD-linked oxidase C-terminal domain-containing protein [Candidatus Gastranaerophilaceae bacterium]
MKFDAAIIDKIKQIVSFENVLETIEERYVYALDATNKQNIETLPGVVVFVETIEQVQKIVRLGYENEIPIVARGAGTNLVGACITTCGGIVLNFSKMNKILEINEQNLTARVQPGVVVGDLQAEVERIGLFYPPDPSNLSVSTIGGSIALCSGGPRTFKYGSTKDYAIDLKVVLADGRILKTGSNTAKNSTGYHMSQFFIGSEGTLGIIVEATFKLIPKPEGSRVILAYFDKISDATNAVTQILKNKLSPATLDFMDKNTIQTIEKFYPSRLLTDKDAVLFLEVDGPIISLDSQQEKIAQFCKQFGASDIRISSNEQEAQKIWTARRSAFGACAKLKPNVVAEDIVVPREKIPQMVEGIRRICTQNNLTVSIVGHIGDGNVHPNISLDLTDENDVKNYAKTKDEIHQLAIDLGGTLSGEHGIGCEKSKYMTNAIDEVTLEYMGKIKHVFDEKNILNPNKIF